MIIATKSRAEILHRALDSIANQTRKPEMVLIIGDSKDDFPNDKDLWDGKIKIKWLLNWRTKNLSGALNTGILHLLEAGFRPTSTYIAILDDDDCWDSNYLQECINFGNQGQFDWVISGLIRHEMDGREIYLNISSGLSQSLFFQRNPHIQGSNMFIKLNCLLEAGMYDENLRSTTDRDICIRLLDLGYIRYGFLNKHYVHHYTDNNDRLSVFESPAKKAGLTAFLSKYLHRMNREDRNQFIARGKEFFGVDFSKIEVSSQEKDCNIPFFSSKLDKSKNRDAFQLVIGVIATYLDCIKKLIKDIFELTPFLPQLKKIVIADNCPEMEDLILFIEASNQSDLEIIIIPKDKIDEDAASGLLGDYYQNLSNRKGIAYGRTALHRALYLECAQLANPVIWILDDDMRLKDMKYEGIPNLDPAQFINMVNYLIDQKINIAVGAYYGDPPLPIVSSIRVQLIELFYLFYDLFIDSHDPDILGFDKYRNYLATIYPDSYYDYSISHFGHLETPFQAGFHLLSDSEKWGQIEIFIRKFKSGKNLLRPSHPIPRPIQMQKIPTRGGNTLIFDTESLRVFPNIAPIVDNISFRRGDTLWCILNKHLGGEKFYAREKRVAYIPFFMQQDRIESPLPNPLFGDVLLSDIFGASFIRALDKVLEIKTQKKDFQGPWAGLAFNSQEVQDCINLMRNYLLRRLLIIKSNMWRVRGLVQAYRTLFNQWQDKNKEIFNQYPILSEFLEILDWIQQQYSTKVESDFELLVSQINYSTIEDFLKSLQKYKISYSTRLLPRLSSSEQKYLTKRLKESGITRVTLIDRGIEGIIFGDGEFAYKVFYSGIHHFSKENLEFLLEKLGNGKELDHIVPLIEIIEANELLIFKMPLIEGEKYQGGFLNQFFNLLQICRQNGIVIRNLSPDNLCISQNKMVYVDLGRDIAPYSDNEFYEMCKRAYLCYRWHFRSEIKEIMRLSLRDPNLPELFGFNYFLQALEERSIYEIMDPEIIKLLEKFSEELVLDYGCYDGEISDKMALAGFKVACYDITAEKFFKKLHNPNLHFLNREELDHRKSKGLRFNLILCNRVLCCIENELEVQKIITDLRDLVSENGRVIIGICNPFNFEVMHTSTHKKEYSIENHYSQNFQYKKYIYKNNNSRLDFHRPVRWYERQFLLSGFEIEGLHETNGIDVDRLSPGSEILFFILKPLPRPKSKSISLLIKAGCMEWRMIDTQVRHIISQLEGPERFLEKILVTDTWTGPFSREFDMANQGVFFSKLKKLQKEGFIDKIVILPEDDNISLELNHKWFGINSNARRTENGQPIHTLLYGLEQCKGDYILQLDSDCLIRRKSRSDNYLDQMIALFDNDPLVLTVSVPICHQVPHTITSANESGKWRVEVRCALIHKPRLSKILPLQNWESKSGFLKIPWHRALDKLLKFSDWKSCRGSFGSIFFIHVPNDRKKDINSLYNIMRAVESDRIPKVQYDTVDLVGPLNEWLESRNEPLIFLLRGQNIPISKIRRCLSSLDFQSNQDWGLLLINAKSTNGSAEFLQKIILPRYLNRVTLFENLENLTPIENIDISIKQLCANPESIITMVDLDDALIGNNVVELISELYNAGKDLTVGSMLRTDKHKQYPIDFSNPRQNRGGNVWQHLRTFKKKLFDLIPVEYFMIDGKWIPHTEDWAFMIPLVELCQNPYPITRPIYFYEPSEEKKFRSIEEREEIITQILQKPSLKDMNR